MLAEAVISGSVLRRAFDALAARSGSVILRVSPSGIYARAVDPLMLSIAEVLMPRDAFTYFSCQDEFEAPVDVESLLEQLKNAGRLDVRLEFREDRIALRKGSVRYELPYVDRKHVRKAPDPAGLPPRSARATMSGDEFKTYVGILAKIADEAVFEYDGAEFAIKGFGEMERVTIRVPDSEGSGEARTAFGTLLLKQTAKTVSGSDVVTAEIGTDVPGLFSVEAEGVRINIVLAPRYVEE